MMAIKELGTPDARLRRARITAGPSYISFILVSIAIVFAVLYMVLGDKLHVDFDVPAVSTSAPAAPTTSTK